MGWTGDVGSGAWIEAGARVRAGDGAQNGSGTRASAGAWVGAGARTGAGTRAAACIGAGGRAGAGFEAGAEEGLEPELTTGWFKINGLDYGIECFRCPDRRNPLVVWGGVGWGGLG